MPKINKKADLSYTIDILADVYGKKLLLIKNSSPAFSISKEIYKKNYNQAMQELSSLSYAISILRKEQSNA